MAVHVEVRPPHGNPPSTAPIRIIRRMLNNSNSHLVSHLPVCPIGVEMATGYTPAMLTVPSEKHTTFLAGMIELPIRSPCPPTSTGLSMSFLRCTFFEVVLCLQGR